MMSASTGTISYRLLRVLSLGCALLGAAPARAQRPTIVLGVARPDSADPRALSVARGLTLGSEEARHTVGLFGVALELWSADGLAMDSAAFHRVGVWIIAGSEARCAAMRRALADTGVPIIDAGCRGDADPLANELRIHPGADSAAALAASGDSTTRVLLWHPALERFGADQLNDRFRRRFTADMDSDAWAAWAAVKIAVEACLRARRRGVAPLAVLRDTTAVFDAHKGAPLRFDPVTGRLVQPLYVVTAGGGAPAIREIAPPAREP